MKLIVGLGNPGAEYKHTRHNVGFMVLEELAKRLDLKPFKPDKKSYNLVTSIDTQHEKLFLALPQTFMNKSGIAVQQIANYYKINPQDILVICDDLDTPFGKIRIRKKGGPGTHNGLKSLVNMLGENFSRIRIGIESRGDTSHEKIDTSSFVLSAFNEEESKDLPGIIDKAAEAIITILEEDVDSAMNKFNT